MGYCNYPECKNTMLLQHSKQVHTEPETFHRRPAVKRRYGNISDSTLYRWIDNGTFPSPEKLGPNTVGWRESVLREYDADPAGWAAKHQTGSD